MQQELVAVNMLTAVVLIVIILASGFFKKWSHRKYDVSPHIDEVRSAADRTEKAIRKSHHA